MSKEPQFYVILTAKHCGNKNHQIKTGMICETFAEEQMVAVVVYGMKQEEEYNKNTIKKDLKNTL